MIFSDPGTSRVRKVQILTSIFDKNISTQSYVNTIIGSASTGDGSIPDPDFFIDIELNEPLISYTDFTYSLVQDETRILLFEKGFFILFYFSKIIIK